jgi:choline dehydrogenase-like flavoprotein
MPIVDLGHSPSASLPALEACDVCIIGSGPAGSAIARELSGTGLRVTLLESGGETRLPEADALDEIENVGRPRHVEQWPVRNRVLGGSSHTWGGRCAPFDEIDFEQRPWVPDAEWPFGLAALTPYLDRSAEHLGLSVGSGFSDERFWALAKRKPPADSAGREGVLPFFWQFSKDGAGSYPFEYMRFGRHLSARVGPNVTIVTGATVLRIHTVESGRAVESVEFAGYDGKRRRLRAATVLLCAGGIENPRLLLASDERSPNGLGNEHDLVGRYLMDHLRGPVARFAVAGSEELQRRFGRFVVDGRLFRAGWRLSPELQHSERLLNCAAWLGEEYSANDPWDSLRRIMGGRPQGFDDVRIVARNAGFLARGLKQYFIDRNGIPRVLDGLGLVAMCEQRPDQDSRVTLSDKRDPLGQRLARVDWRAHDDESRTMRRMGELVAAECERLGFPPAVLEAWVRDGASMPDSFVDVAHPTGTTRMATDPTKGVVDAQCQLHGVAGLYVAGSSVFPSAGHCNPTQMIVALAIRLADQVKLKAVRAPAAVTVSARQRTGAPRVLVTGATGRIGDVVCADLLKRGYAVRATTSRSPSRSGTAMLEWRQADFFADDLDYDALVGGCDAIIHLAAELGKRERMQRVNAEATRRLAEAAERLQVKAFCYASTVSVYGSGLKRTMTEDSPVLTADRDVPSEYWALDYVREYGRTKLAGEYAIKAVASDVRYTLMRPAVVVSLAQIIGVRDWSPWSSALSGRTGMPIISSSRMCPTR